MAVGRKKSSVTVVRIPGKRTKVSVPAGSSVSDLLAALSINRETVVVRRDGRVIPESEPLADGDKVEVISVISGG